MTPSWQSELKGLLDTVPGGAERLIRAIDENRMNGLTVLRPGPCGSVGCVYGHVYGDEDVAVDVLYAAQWGSGGIRSSTRLERELIDSGSTNIRPEVVCWLAEHGSTPERSSPAPTHAQGNG